MLEKVLPIAAAASISEVAEPGMAETLARRGWTPVLRSLHGSRLYGAALPDSDIDHRWLHLPSGRDILLAKPSHASRTRPGSSGEELAADDSSVSLAHFLRLIGQFDMGMLEVLFAAGDPALSRIFHPVMHEVLRYRDQLIGGGIAATISHARVSIGRFAILKAERLDAYESVVAVLDRCRAPRLALCPETIAALHAIPHVNLHFKRHQSTKGVSCSEVAFDPVLHAGLKLPDHVLYLQVRSRAAPATAPLEVLKATFRKPLTEMRSRARIAREAPGSLDWKGIAHAVRLIGQGIELHRDRRLTLPRPDAADLIAIRRGERPIEAVVEEIETGLEVLDAEARRAPFPETGNARLAEDLLIEAHLDQIRRFRAGL